MKDRDYFKMRAAAARAAAVAAKDVASCRIHMDMAKEYEFRAAMEPDAPPPPRPQTNCP